MKTKIDLSFFFDGSIQKDIRTTKEYKKNLNKVSKAASKLITELKNKSNEIINSFSLAYQQKIKFKREQIKKKNKILVIGMGGSSSGSKAINGVVKKNIFFLDSFDPEHINNFLSEYNLKEFTIFIISKSGNTLETLANFNLIYKHLIKVYDKNEIKKNIFIIAEKSKNILNNLAKQIGVPVIVHNKNIGGRFSAFSETAMILFDLDPRLVSMNANQVILKLIQNNLDDQNNPIINAATILTLQKRQNIKFNVNILYDYSLKNFSYWYHQLFAESLGKNNIAMTPLTSICPKDHHSMMQLFIGGPKDKLFNIYISKKKSNSEDFYDLGLFKLPKKNPDTLLKDQCTALIKTFRNNKIPHRIITLENNLQNKEYNLLEIMAYHIIETILLGYAQGINPYDQPEVEQIKVNTLNC